MSNLQPDEIKLIYKNSERISVVETNIGFIREDIGKILNNHLAHIQVDFKEMQEHMSDIKDIISELKQTNSKNAPIMSIIVDIIKLTLVAVGSAILVLVIK